jgi:hypothetical protein
VEQIRRDVYRVNLSGTPWTVDFTGKEPTCTCPNYQDGHNPACIHIICADAVAAVPAGPGASVIVARLVELCRGIKTSTGPLMSMQILNEVHSYRWSTQAMRKAAIQRHARRAA